MELFLLWVALLLVLGVAATAPIPVKARVVAGLAAVLTVWLLWGIYGASFFSRFATGNLDELVQDVFDTNPLLGSDWAGALHFICIR